MDSGYIKEWADEIWSKIEKKVAVTSERMGDKIFPYTAQDGIYSAHEADYWWTLGFWPGILWHMYIRTGEQRYRDIAESLENQMDVPLYRFEELHHDVGFMWLHTSVINYRLTGNEQSRRRALLAATILAGRFNINGNFIRSWSGGVSGWSIIDSMMNIPILYWAGRHENDPRFTKIATNHADTVERTFVRPDGSVNHINSFDPNTGEFIETFGGQGYETGSSWTRGQSWALYGFVLSYIHTKKQSYLDAAKRVAHYFIAALGDDFIPDCDFRCPKEPVYKDTSAGAIAACGLIEISRNVPELEKDLYLNAAYKILKATEEHCCDWSPDTDALVNLGSLSYKQDQNVPNIFGDYFFVEAISKLKGGDGDVLFW